MFVVKLEKHVADKNRQLIPQWSAFTYANMYGVKFEQVSQRNCLFCGKLSEKPTLLSEVIYERTRKEHSKKWTPLKRLSSFSGISNKLFLSLTNFTKS